MGKNKTSKYLKYAIGEIVLVVIGILIALSINNWNEERKIRNQEQNSLVRLHVESENIVAYLNTSVESYKNLITAVERSAKALSEGALGSLSEEDFALGIYGTAYYEAIAPPKNVFEELNSTGKIQNIRSTGIRKRLSDYYSKLEYINTQLVYFRNQYTKPVEAAGAGFLYEYENASIYKLKASVDFKKLRQNDEFKSKHIKALRDLIAFHENRIALLESAQNMCQEISTAIDAECKSNPTS